jgi:transcriptional regulator with XRE-family HTH domain
MLSKFGAFLKTLMIKKDNMTQEALAKDLKCSPSYLSSILNGQVSPGIEFLKKCKEYFNLGNEDTIELFRTAFSSSKTITLDMSYFPPQNQTWMIDLLTTFLLYPKLEFITTDEISFTQAIDTINSILAQKTELNPLDEKDR